VQTTARLAFIVGQSKNRAEHNETRIATTGL